MKIGLAGCGRMGFGMARAMARAGLDVTGFDIRPVGEFGDFADRMVGDPAIFASDREVILTVVRDIAQTEALLFDDQAILSRAPALKYLVVCSTLSPRSRRSSGPRRTACPRSCFPWRPTPSAKPPPYARARPCAAGDDDADAHGARSHWHGRRRRPGVLLRGPTES